MKKQANKGNITHEVLPLIMNTYFKFLPQITSYLLLPELHAFHYSGSIAFEFTKAKREREEGSEKLCTKSHFHNCSFGQATGRPTTSMLSLGICSLKKLSISHLLSTSLYVVLCMR